MKTLNGYTLDSGDSPESELITGRKSKVIVHGNELDRDFKVIYCNHCKLAIKPMYIPCLTKYNHKYPDGHKYRLIADSAFNQRVHHNNECRNNALKKADMIERMKPKDIKTIAQQSPEWTDKQLAGAGMFIRNPAKYVLTNMVTP